MPAAPLTLLPPISNQVISDKTPQMAIVAVPRLIFHPRYRFWRVVQTKCYAHDEERSAGLGDIVRIKKSPVRLSKLKECVPPGPARSTSGSLQDRDDCPSSFCSSYMMIEVVKKEPSREFLEKMLAGMRKQGTDAATRAAAATGLGQGFAATGAPASIASSGMGSERPGAA